MFIFIPLLLSIIKFYNYIPDLISPPSLVNTTLRNPSLQIYTTILFTIIFLILYHHQVLLIQHYATHRYKSILKSYDHHHLSIRHASAHNQFHTINRRTRIPQGIKQRFNYISKHNFNT